MTKPRPRLLFLVTEDWAFWRHRRPMARAARAAGFEVAVACRVSTYREAIEAEGFRVIPLPWNRQGANPFTEAVLLARVVALLRRERPDLVHAVALKPAVHGALAADFAGRPPVVVTVAGMGYVYSANTVKARMLRPVISLLFRLVVNRNGRRLMVQNTDDRAYFVGRGLVADQRTVLVPGSGVDVELFHPAPEPEGTPVFAYVGRMTREKGLLDLIEAARLLRARSVDARVVLVGAPDPGNPTSVPEATLRDWQAQGLVEWLGLREDINAVWAQAHVAVLPSTSEGLPKMLLEAGAAGRPAVATDVPGTRDLVVDGETGVLVPLHDPRALAEALAALAGDPERRRRLGAAARERVTALYSAEAIGAATVAVYRTQLEAPSS
ncbi:glycosyltransferase family 4 protein [Pararhodospirillum oryzae]|uniref:Glycosyl transferase family 1 n=1 Tax=Pararhodospirillum oryzae TaxID=478448 RepID=A0A512H3W1_9PROT|nr:glycosyltransferase family 4 protein [Pararhodospirillum oryzae]GEO80070.1 glycosyl transferase family 1 [Pararhodospirillum oryzae]